MDRLGGLTSLLRMECSGSTTFLLCPALSTRPMGANTVGTHHFECLQTNSGANIKGHRAQENCQSIFNCPEREMFL